MTDNASIQDLDITCVKTKTARDLLEAPLAVAQWIVEAMIFVGLVVLAGPPKIGKSWFAAWLAVCVSQGLPFLEHATRQAGVLYLCLEDTFPRIQQRLFRLVDSANDSLYFAVEAKKLRNGLIEQLKQFIEEHPDVRMIIIDTLQLIRSITKDSAYAADYDDLRPLKQFADENELAIILVHHTRKMPDESNVFNTVSGSNGIIGSADEAMVLTKSNVFDGKATLSITGRDVELAEYKLTFKDCRWTLVEQTSQEELAEREIPDSVLRVLDFMSNRAANWEGTASQLIEEAEVPDIPSNVLTKYLNEHSAFLRERGIEYGYHRTANARLLSLKKIVQSEEAEPIAGDENGCVSI